jgi:hypothetical protein
MAETPGRARLARNHRTWHVLAAWEAAKGCIVLAAVVLAGAGLWQWPAHALGAVAFLNHWPRTPSGLLLWAAAGYSALRFVEAAGLWQERSWARWFSIAGNAAYIPVELWELAHGANWPMAAALALNVVAVGTVLAMQPAPSGQRQLARNLERADVS